MAMTRPVEARSSPPSNINSDDLPEPEGPIRPTELPVSTVIEIS